jgi:AcrR family transcriptional regulator
LDRFSLSPQTIDALAAVISGGGGNDSAEPIGIYRSGSKLERFMRSCGVDMQIGSGSRVPALTDTLLSLHRMEDSATLQKVLQAAADPRDFINSPEKHTAVLEHLNTHLWHDGLELQYQGQQVRLVAAGTSAPIITELGKAVQTFDFDTVQRELERALANAASDPEDAITAACSLIEGVCRSVLIELDKPLPAKRDISSLYRAVRDPLGLSPDRTDLPEDSLADIKTVLGGLSAVVQGIGSLRTNVGDAHGRERGFKRVDARIARLAIHSAGNVSLFFIETWQAKFPTKPLVRH